MNLDAGRARRGYQVVCAWCGVVIRRTDTKSSQGMCLKCYARMLSEHNRAGEQAGRAFKASDR